ncbi:hypothetical protein ACQEUV_33110 [Micromonospora aurantiaca (nom. illeg.)]|uniref:hypothetical protein n=1 Tax=Micromonospora aurantiaca (nom. illeg.) TaxID=47850 RepID=UPI003DA385B3
MAGSRGAPVAARARCPAGGGVAVVGVVRLVAGSPVGAWSGWLPGRGWVGA